MKSKTKTTNTPTISTPAPFYTWLLVLSGTVFFLPQCLDRYLISRFFALSLVLLVGLVFFYRYFLSAAKKTLLLPDVLVLLWYGWNLASIAWAYNWSEAVFYTQKVFLLLLVYGYFRSVQEQQTTLRQIALSLSILTMLLLGAQIAYAFSQFGLDNEHLYDYASGIWGNKGLASDFLLLCLLWLGYSFPQFKKPKRILFIILLGILLIVLLQTRAVYLALAAAVLAYVSLRSVGDTGFRKLALKWALPGLATIAICWALVITLGKNTSLGQRLNPATYLNSASANERRFVWYKTDLLNQDHVWLGVGNGSWKIWLPSKGIQGAYRLQEEHVVFTRAHNDFLEIRAELGLIGIILYGCFLGALLWGLVAGIRTGDVHRKSVLAAAITAYCTIQYFDFPRERIDMQVLSGFFFALAVNNSDFFQKKGPRVAIAPWLKKSALLCCVLGLLFNLVLGWYRIKGETANALMQKAQFSNRPNDQLRYAQKAQNTFYQMDDTATPLIAHEGAVYLSRKDVAAAEQALLEAIAISPWNYQIQNNYAAALTMRKDFKEAVPHFEEAVRINPRYEEGKINLAYSWIMLGDLEKAQAWLQQMDTTTIPQTTQDSIKHQQFLQRKERYEQVIKDKMKQ